MFLCLFSKHDFANWLIGKISNYGCANLDNFCLLGNHKETISQYQKLKILNVGITLQEQVKPPTHWTKSEISKNSNVVHILNLN